MANMAPKLDGFAATWLNRYGTLKIQMNYQLLVLKAWNNDDGRIV